MGAINTQQGTIRVVEGERGRERHSSRRITVIVVVKCEDVLEGGENHTTELDIESCLIPKWN